MMTLRFREYGEAANVLRLEDAAVPPRPALLVGDELAAWADLHLAAVPLELPAQQTAAADQAVIDEAVRPAPTAVLAP